MQKAASNNDVSAANQLLEKGNTLDPDEKLALVSAENGSFEFIEFLKSKNYDILESQGGVSTIPFGQMANKLGVWNKNKMVGFPGK